MQRYEPLVSAVIPAFNAARFIEQAIDSVLAQTYTNYEIIVVDDGSSDDTLEKLKSYGNKVTIISQPNKGVSSARNAGIMKSRGEWVAFLDADDYWEKEKLARQIDYIKQNHDVVLVHTGKRLFGEHGTIEYDDDEAPFHLLRQSANFRSLLVRNCVNTSSVMVKRDVVVEAGMFDITLRQCEDQDLWLRVAKRGQLGYIPEDLFNYRMHGGQATAKTGELYEDGLRVIRRNRCLVGSFPEYLAWRKGYATRLLDAGYFYEQQGLRYKAFLYFLWSLWFWPFDHLFVKLKSMMRAII
jgi:glycosyltransferase involved in cell wall biosynthesis